MRSKNFDLSYKEAHQFFTFDPDVGELRNRFARHAHVVAGALAGSPHPGGYRRVQIAGKVYLAHRIAWFMHFGMWPKDQLDHINRDKTDNRIANLRECGAAENQQNHDNTHRKGTSRYMGVCKPSSREGWRAQIRVDGKPIYLGMYRCETAAYVAYCQVKPKLHTFVSNDKVLAAR